MTHEQAGKIAATVREMLDNLSDFEPRRWFSKLRPQAGRRKEEAQGGLASLTAPRTETRTRACLWSSAHELAPGWVVDEPILSIGGRSHLDEAAAAMLAEVLKKRGLDAKA